MKNYLLLFTVLIMLNGCSSDSDYKYLDARTAAKLEVPPDLTQITLSEKFEIPSNISSGVGETHNKIPVLAQVESIRLEGDANFYWLVIEGMPENLYKTIKNFWGSEGFTLDIDEPAIGILQTHWVLKEEGEPKDKGFIARIFSGGDLSTSQDQYRTRIEKDSASNTIRIYISHRGTHRLVAGELDEKEIDWAFRPSEPELEIEMLSRLMIYLGLEGIDADQQLANVKLFTPRASIHIDSDEGQAYILVRTAQQQTWNRLLHEFNRLDIEVVSAIQDTGLSNDGVIVVKTEYRVEEKGWWSTLFSSGQTNLVQKEVVLVVSEETHEFTRVSIETPDGEVDESPEGLEFLTMLFERMK